MKTITCPCCLTEYDDQDSPEEFKRVEKFIAKDVSYTRFNSGGFLKLYRNGVQIASTALPGMEGVEYLNDIENSDRNIQLHKTL